MKRSAALFAALALFGVCAARAGVQELANKLSWTGSPTVIYLNGTTVVGTNSIDSAATYDNLVLVYTDTSNPGILVIDDTVKANARILVVGGGGAGGTSTSTNGGPGGGGGAGGFIETTRTLNGGSYTVTVGAGGAAAASLDVATPGEDGTNSSFGTDLIAHGGGGGGAMSEGHAGGSGGGGSAYYDTDSGKVNKDGGASTASGDESGNAGGKGSVAGYGGGGGGAGAVGQDSAATKSKGGAGLASDITGEEINYAGGGGGGRTKVGSAFAGGKGGGGAGGSTAADAVAGIDGLGGGGGGSGTTAVGGKGGDGVVIVRITQLVEAQVSVPVIGDEGKLTYNGENQVAWSDFGIAYTFVDGVTNATNFGTYNFQVQPGPELEWIGGGTQAKTVTWRIVKRQIDKPVAVEGIVFTGTETNGVTYTEDCAAYCTFADTSVTNATNARTYSYTVSLNDNGANTMWSDGTIAPVTGTWTIAPARVARPTLIDTNFVYNATERSVFVSLDTERYILSDGVVRATDGGDYSFTLKLNGNILPTVTNYVWDTDPATPDPYVGEWKISPAPNEIASLSLKGWRLGTTPNVPTVTATWGADTVQYQYGFGETAADITEWLTEATAINLPGTWFVKATIPATPSWNGTTDSASFVMWSNPGELFRDYVDIKIAGTTGTQINFPALVRISEERMEGFLYSRVGSGGLLFVDTAGNLLNHEIDTWDESGESLIWVGIPELPPAGTTIRMHWNLKDGQAAPENVPADVWSGYAGVWHMKETITTSTQAQTAKSYDSTTNQNHATPRNGGTGTLGQMLSTTGVIGNARVNSSTASKAQGNRLQTATAQTFNGVFTLSGWFKMNTTTANTYPRLVGAKVGAIDSDGWSIETGVASSKNLYVRGNGSSAITSFAIPDDLVADWVYLTFVYSNTTASVYSNGKFVKSGTITAVKDTAQPLVFGAHGAPNGSEYSLNGSYDEIRISGQALPAARIAAEYTSVVSNDFTSPASPVSRDGLYHNFWVVVPTMDKTIWDASETPGVFTAPGELRHGSFTNVIYSVYDPTRTFTSTAELTEEGAYRIEFFSTLTEADGYEPVGHMINVRVITSKPYTKIGGTNGNSGRVLLMNRDTNTKCPIDYQGFSDSRDTYNTFWDHLNSDGNASGGNLPFNLQLGTESVLMTKGRGKRLWHIVDCRHGNTCPTTATGELSGLQNYLPYSSTSKSFKARVSAANQSTAGQIVMRNMEDATIYSSCFTNGIGTIYFDAVNGWARSAEDYENYKLVVEIATNAAVTIDDEVTYLPPTDDNSASYTPVLDPETGETVSITTNWYGNLEGQWIPVEMIPYKRDTTNVVVDAAFVKGAPTTELTLDVTHGGTMDNFFRVAVPLDILGPVRFRIRRTTCVPHSGNGSFGIDEGGFILLDNVIASLPAMRGDLVSAGHFEAEKTGGQTLGWELATSVPYPAATDAVVMGSAAPEYYLNAGDGTAPDTRGFFSSATMHYRWRYLNQEAGDWKMIDLNPTDFRALAPFELPGRACDVEYWFEYALQAPFYEYVDYSGLGKLIDYTEERGVLTNRLGNVVQASAGTDWYFRVRDGQSPYAGLDIVFRRGESAAPERAPMTLVGDHVWRGFIQTKENQTGEIAYRVEAFDYTTEPFADYVASTNYWYCKLENPDFPVSDKLEEDGTAETWSKLTLDAVTGYVMFQIDDRTHSLTVVHADYQNFNGWSDALGRQGRDGGGRTVGPVFVGTSTTNEYKVGVSPSKQTFSEDFSDWQTMPATNAFWGPMPTFSDIQPNHLLGRQPYTTFAADTNGLWSVGQGMWVAKRYVDQRDNKGVALQMEGNGKGYLQFIDRDSAPRGVESVTFNARLGQFVRFEDFAYYYGGTEGILNISNYTFMARTAFDLNKNQNFAGAASLSLVANYLPNKGCYEARWEWLGNRDTSSGTHPGLRLCLYRWNVINGAKRSELIIARTNTSDFAINQVTGLDKAADASHRFVPMFISVSNDAPNKCTYIIAGVRREGLSLALSPVGTTSSDANGKNWFGVCYKDTDQTKRLAKGTYGVLSANCEGVFARPEFSHTVQTTVGNFPGSSSKSSFSNSALDKIANLQNIKNCAEQDLRDAEYPGWNIISGRMKTTYSSADVNAVQSDTVAQQLQIYLGTAGRADWGATPVKTLSLSGFGSSSGGSQYKVDLWSTKDSSIRFAVAGTIDDVRTDVVLDSVKMTQWRGGDWNDDSPVNGVSEYLPAWADAAHRTDVNAFSNFVFTSCWVTNHTVLMSAKRSNLETPCAIRAPLMDGWVRNGRGGDGTSRGKGLGMVSVSYANAQENVVLQLQIATNAVDYTSIAGYDLSFSDSIWTTVTNFTFSGMTAAQRKSGVLNCYVGLHDVAGAMRLLMSTNVIQAVAKETNTQRFGDITITDIVCRDEPAVDVHSWWGWNMRTVGGDEDSEKRMLLSDFGLGAGAAGLSLALNNSVDPDYNVSKIDVSDRESYLPHKPFVQTPTFTSNVVGEVAFKARKYDRKDADSTIVLYGSTDASATDDGTWKKLDGAVFTVSNTWYETYSYKTDPGQSYRAFRLAVVGVSGVQEDVSGGGNGLPPGVSSPERVMIDEIFVSEAVRARMGFKNVGCFKSDMAGTEEVPNVPSPAEQPLCEEAWGVQCEVYGAQLADDIDFTRKPRVRLHWFDDSSMSDGGVRGGDYPWGFEKWRDLSGHKSAWLSQVTGGEEGRYVYRSSQRTCPEAVIGMSRFAPTYVQYMLEVVYYTKGSTVPTTNWLSSADWQTPAWYRPLDLNASRGGNQPGAFAAYNILDTVAPGWAWINEANITGDIDADFDNGDADCQFVEIAQPPEADLSGWSVQLLIQKEGLGTVITNTLGTFGMRELTGKKDLQWVDPTANMVFRVLANKGARTSGKLSYDDGTLDGVWAPEVVDAVFTRDGEISSFDAVGLQLVRSSGIVEHQVVVKGTNLWEDLEVLPETYPAYTKAYLESHLPRSEFVLTPYDNQGEPYSVGVFQNNGSSSNDWTNLMRKTPGRLNEGQTIDPDHPVPSGEGVLVYLTVSGDHIGQWNGESFTNGILMLTVVKGSQRGTNVTYRLDPWYVLGSATANGTSLMDVAQRTKTTMPYEFTIDGIGKGASNNVVVVATAAPDPRFATDWGVEEDNPYRPAILDWLGKGTDLYGNRFADLESGEIRLAEFRTMNNTFVTNMTLTEMYWLDMDPTAGQLALIGGMASAPVVHQVTDAVGQQWDNLRMGVYMMITNESASLAVVDWVRRGPNDFGTHWTPYALRGLEPGSSSLTFNPALEDWDSTVSFKMTARILNAYTRPENLSNWVPLRLFVFKPDSFGADGISRIEVIDPHSPESMGNNAFAREWAEDEAAGRPLTGLGYFWSIDTRQRPSAVEVLKQENYYGD